MPTYPLINNQKETARLLLKKGANIDFGGALDASPLCGAIVAGHLDMVAFLLENGANPNYGKHLGTPCLEFATFEKQDIAMVTNLLAYGANMESIINEGFIFAQLTDFGRNSFAESLEKKQNQIDMIKVFLQYGASPDVRHNGKMIRDMEIIYKPLKALLTLESAFRRNDYKEIGAIDKKDLAAFVQWKAEMFPVIKDGSKGKFEYIKNLLELDKFSKEMSLDLDDSIKQPLIKLREKMAKLAPSLKFLCLSKIADIIDSDVKDEIALPEDVIKAMTDYGLLQVEATGETETHTDLV